MEQVDSQQNIEKSLEEVEQLFGLGNVHPNGFQSLDFSGEVTLNRSYLVLDSATQNMMTK